MIRSVRIRGFKRFGEVEIRLSGHLVLAGPNDTGKTTLLQAIASWALALRRWRDLNDYHRCNGYRQAPITRQAFGTVPLSSFTLLWPDRRYRGLIEIELHHEAGWAVTMELIADTTEQIYVRPTREASPQVLRDAELEVAYVPPMTGLGLHEPVLLPPTIAQLLSGGRPGEVLRNVLADAYLLDRPAWDAVQTTINRLFGYRLLPPDAAGAHILAQYAETGRGAPLDLASAGSGFLQLLLLLTIVNTRRGAVLLLDEPAAHLHVTLQDTIYDELRNAADRHGSQLIVATHSKAIIDAVDARELLAME